MDETTRTLPHPLARPALAALGAIAVLAGIIATHTTPATAESGGIAPDADDGDGTRSLRLRSARAKPSLVLEGGKRRARFKFRIAGDEPRDALVALRRGRNGEVVRRWRLRDLEPRRLQLVRWNGRRGNGHWAPTGRYEFAVSDPGGGVAENGGDDPATSFRYAGHKFPLRGRHSYGDGLGAGRRHRGQDVFGRCGHRVVAARAGRVTVRAYQRGGAGYYLVVDGKRTGRDYVYMHLKRRGRARRGERVRTGETIGRNGRSGNAAGCHLHFELWSAPGWYRGGHVLDPTPPLRKWDGWS